MLHIDDFEAYCFDLDGTIYVGNQLLPGVKETIDIIRRNHKKILFITNAPTHTREDCHQLLCSLGVSAELDEVITASSLSATYFLENFPHAIIYIVGERAIKQEFTRNSLNITEDPLEATHVLVGLDRSFTYEKLNSAMNAIRNGAQLIVTNPDPSCPVPGGYMADTLAIAKAIEVASDKSIDQVIGKPSSYYANKIREKLSTSSDKCLIVGDRLETDIMMGKTNNIQTCLVLTGVSSKKDIERTNITPDYIIEDLKELFSDTRNPS
ncbi:HAD-IIA family hydrolase [Psychrobacillus vulpis]|uniref:Acid sugar phosphatase n=1 Tax=Psychrobacillus vulpis TaxID=2325572 RepID=A0A544TMI9_9BACI|nr:HAD-IIA family hydrolase [Psychrobacillus vulpis]TQR18667.1 HAD-IIA family hydrolase [Psychrobacillus vulpis]